MTRSNLIYAIAGVSNLAYETISDIVSGSGTAEDVANGINAFRDDLDRAARIFDSLDIPFEEELTD